MKPKRSFEPHLVLKQMALPPGSEWTVEAPGWSFLHITTGTGYWLHPRRNHELATGAVLVVSDRAQGVTRASQLSELLIHYFRLQPERLSGLVSWGEQQFLEKVAVDDQLSARVFPPTAPLSEKLRGLCQNVKPPTFTLRIQLVDLFVHAFRDELASHKTASTALIADAKSRLLNLLNQTSASELLDLTFADLIQETRCTARHLSRIFHQVVGMSFREKQAQVRLLRARELLATTESKVVEVALESGYQSLSLFNLMFKRRFGMTPAKWRDQARNRAAASRNGDGRLQMLRA
jgi:AraC-like DNA-binding protein